MTGPGLMIDRDKDIPLIKQLYDQIRHAILRGDFHSGERLPSSRQLAMELNVSRIVVVEVYEQLLAEGSLASRTGAGTYVAEGAALDIVQSETTCFDVEEGRRQNGRQVIDFRAGVPALRLFPRHTWGRLAMQVCTEAADRVFGYDQPHGCAELRSALARYLARTRRIRCHPDQILVTTGAAQAFSLVARLLHSAGGEVVIEDPVTYDMRRIFLAAGAALLPTPVDDLGIKTDLLPAGKCPDFVYVTPSHQFPLGGVLPIQRRIQLIQYAREANCYVVEDDYDSEFRYSGTPVSSLQELAPERVIYVGTMSKCLSPALRLGYAVLPVQLVEEARQIKMLSDRHAPVLEQLMLARLVEEGALDRHILRMKKVYRKRRETLIHALKGAFSDSVCISGDTTGMHLIADFYGVIFSDTVLAELEAQGVRFYPVEAHAICKGRHTSKVILGYGNLEPTAIEEGILLARRVLGN